MPSPSHELPLRLLRDRPQLLVELLARVGVQIGGPLAEIGASFAELEPAVYVADLVLANDDVTVIVEAQGDGVDRKRWVWPLYVASALAERRRPTWLVVFARDELTARRARQPISAFQGGAFAPVVIGPSDVPRITDLGEAARRPELAVLSALAHARGPDALAVGIAALRATGAIEDEARGMLYAAAVLDALGDLAKPALEAVMKIEPGYQWKSDFARHYVGVGREEGRQEGRQEDRLATLRQLCAALGLEYSDERGRAAVALDHAQFASVIRTLVETRRWPD